jgi:hypothetical protein
MESWENFLLQVPQFPGRDDGKDGPGVLVSTVDWMESHALILGWLTSTRSMKPFGIPNYVQGHECRHALYVSRPDLRFQQLFMICFPDSSSRPPSVEIHSAGLIFTGWVPHVR